MKIDFHKIRNSKRWKQKHQKPIETKLETLPAILNQSIPEITSTSETVENDQTQLLQDMKNMELISDSSYFQFKQEKNMEYPEYQLPNLNNVQSSIMTLPMSQIFKTSEDFYSLECLHWNISNDIVDSRDKKVTSFLGFLNICDPPQSYDTPSIPSSTQYNHQPETPKDSEKFTSNAITHEQSDGISIKNNENLEEWLDDILG